MTEPSNCSFWDRCGRIARVAAYACVLCAASAWWLKSRVAAELGERSLLVGERLAAMQNILSGTSRLELNGQPVSLNSTSTHASVKEVLDRFTRLCASASGGTTEELHSLVASGRVGLPRDLPVERFGVLRAEDAELRGVAACFARDDRGRIGDLLGRLARVVETGDLGQLGQLRYVYARHRPGSNSTHVISVWTHGSIPLERMFPERGDAPGSDLFDGVRPGAATRLLSVQLVGTHNHMALYETDQPLEQALRAFDIALEARGFKNGDLSLARDFLPTPTRVYIKPDDIVLVLTEPARRDERNRVAAFRLLQGGYVVEHY